jgi:hypothetical protein
MTAPADGDRLPEQAGTADRGLDGLERVDLEDILDLSFV